MTNFLFYFFSLNLIITSNLMIVAQNSVYSAFFLVLSFIAASALMFIFECSFVAIIFLIIYVGAIAVLFVFVVMMLNLKINKLLSNLLKHFPFRFFIFSAVLIELYYLFNQQFLKNLHYITFSFNFYENWFNKIDLNIEVESLGQVLYSFYVTQFLIAGLILLLSVIGSVVLVLNLNSTEIRTVFRQNARSSILLQ